MAAGPDTIIQVTLSHKGGPVFSSTKTEMPEVILSALLLLFRLRTKRAIPNYKEHVLVVVPN